MLHPRILRAAIYEGDFCFMYSFNAAVIPVFCKYQCSHSPYFLRNKKEPAQPRFTAYYIIGSFP